MVGVLQGPADAAARRRFFQLCRLPGRWEFWGVWYHHREYMRAYRAAVDKKVGLWMVTENPPLQENLNQAADYGVTHWVWSNRGLARPHSVPEGMTLGLRLDVVGYTSDQLAELARRTKAQGLWLDPWWSAPPKHAIPRRALLKWTLVPAATLGLAEEGTPFVCDQANIFYINGSVVSACPWREDATGTQHEELSDVLPVLHSEAMCCPHGCFHPQTVVDDRIGHLAVGPIAAGVLGRESKYMHAKKPKKKRKQTPALLKPRPEFAPVRWQKRGFE